MLDIPKIEVHLSNILEREDFRKVDLIEDVCQARFMGKKLDSYLEAVTYILTLKES
jgi:3-dehydroquinate dehydratase II